MWGFLHLTTIDYKYAFLVIIPSSKKLINLMHERNIDGNMSLNGNT